MTDNDIITGLACCGKGGLGCNLCPYRSSISCKDELIDDAFDILDRAFATIERLEGEIEKIRNGGRE